VISVVRMKEVSRERAARPRATGQGGAYRATPVGAGPGPPRGGGSGGRPTSPSSLIRAASEAAKSAARKTAAAVWNRLLTIELGQCPAPGAVRRKDAHRCILSTRQGEHCSRVCVPPLAGVGLRHAASQRLL
jgi:hypothetical protein